MSTYLFLNTKTGEEEEIFMTISERDAYLKDNPHIQQLVNGFPGTCDPVRIGRVKPSGEFRDLLKTIKKNSGRRSTINTW